MISRPQTQDWRALHRHRYWPSNRISQSKVTIRFNKLIYRLIVFPMMYSDTLKSRLVARAFLKIFFFKQFISQVAGKNQTAGVIQSFWMPDWTWEMMDTRTHKTEGKGAELNTHTHTSSNTNTTLLFLHRAAVCSRAGFTSFPFVVYESLSYEIPVNRKMQNRRFTS